MKAIICESYGSIDAIKIKEIETPRPKSHEVLIRVRASSITTADWRIRTQTMPFGFGLIGRLIFGITRPRNPILGGDLSGEIIDIGADVSNFKKGDLVVASTGMSMGCHTEYICLPDTSMIIKKPECLSHEEATSFVFGGTCAFDFLKNKAKIKYGDDILIIGASGSVGVSAIQIAKYHGANVTAVCSEKNKQTVLELGADSFLDYRTDSFKTHPSKYDIVLDCVGSNLFSKNRNFLKTNGKLLLITADLPTIMFASILSKLYGIKIIAGPQSETIENLEAVFTIVNHGNLTPVIDTIFKIDNAKDAHALVATRRKKGNVVIQC